MVDLDRRIPDQFVRTGNKYQEEIDAFCAVIRQEARKKNTAHKAALKEALSSFRKGQHMAAFCFAVKDLSIDKELLVATYFMLFPERG